MKKITSVFLLIFGTIIAILTFRGKSFIMELISGQRKLSSLPSGVQPFMLAGVILLIFVLVGIVYFIFQTSRKAHPAEEEAAPGDKEKPSEKPFRIGDEQADSTYSETVFSTSSLRKSFAKAKKLLKANVSGKDFLYQIPWILMIGPAASGKTSLLRKSRLNFSIGTPPRERRASKNVCNWWFFEKGIVLDIAGELVTGKADSKFKPVPWHEKIWRLLLKLLQDYRARRPIDGVVLTVPCTDITGVGEKESNLASIAKKADMLYQKLWHIQKFLGIRFPVYVLISQCDNIKGFKELCNELPQKFAGDIFGWSNPYALDTSYSDNWTGEAFHKIEQILTQVQFEVFAKGTKAENSEGMLLFPSDFRSLAEPLEVFTDHLFRQSVYHESFMLRGIYFCGDDGFFVKDVFDKKIFPEFSIARPLRSTLISKTRKVIAMQVIVALIVIASVIGIGIDGYNLSKNTDELMEVVLEIDENATKRLKEQQQRGSLLTYTLLRTPDEAVLFRDETVQLLEDFSNVWSLHHYSIPSSWFSSIHKKVTVTIIIAFNNMIITNIYVEMIQKTRQILNSETSGQSPDVPYVLYAEQLPEIAQMNQLIQSLETLEKHVLIYNRLATAKDLKTEDLRELGHLVKYLYKTDLPPNFYEGAEYCLAALNAVDYREYELFRFKGKTKKQMLELVNRTYDRLFQDNILQHHLQILSDDLKQFDRKKRQSSSDDEQLIRDIVKVISQAEETLAKSEAAWIFARTFDMGRSFDEILYKTESSGFMGSDFRSELEGQGNARFQEFREKIARIKAGITGPLLAREGEHIIARLSDDVLKLKADFEKFLSQKFMTSQKNPRLDIAFPPGSRLMWDTALLNDAVMHLEPFDKFVNLDMRSFKGGAEYTVSRVAHANMDQLILDIISRSYRFEPLSMGISGVYRETELEIEIKNFREAIKLLNLLITYANHLGLPDTSQVLSNILYWQSSRLFSTVDDLFENEKPYSIRENDFAWWDGSTQKNIALGAFGVTDEKELEHYLELQRERIRYLAYEYAEPLVTFFLTNKILRRQNEKQMVFKWERILSELEKYENRKPENTVVTLEKFILFEMNTINERNYTQKITRDDLKAFSGDIFLERRNDLRRLLYNQCWKLALQHTVEKYTGIKSLFDELLAGRFPFSGIPNNGNPTAVPADIRDFFRGFDSEAPALKDMLGKSREFGISGANVLDFLARMESVREFFVSYLEPEKKTGDKKNSGKDVKTPEPAGKTEKKAEVPEFGVDVEFRVQQAHELQANQIAGWKFSAGNRVFEHSGTNASGIWQFGEPILFFLRWAKNGTDYPVFGGKYARTEDKTVIYKFNNPWALLHFLRACAVSPGAAEQLLTDTEPHTLEFDIDTMRAGMEGKENGKSATKMFVRLVLSSSDKTKKQLIIPAFPENAPELQVENRN
ncbi:MAG: hypothetical protein GY795_22840 [Desulfobacterales bacterium]|nr:hypothetical protein [Desulfobacterales bacterium]